MRSQYTFTDYSPDWPAEFQREAARLRELLPGEIVTVHHIGSTSVPGLAAKRVIDLLPLIRSVSRLDDLTGNLEAAGYKAWGEYGLPGRRFFTKDHNGYRTHNLHFYEANDPDVERHLAFCAFLRKHDSIRDEYGAMKRALFLRLEPDMEAYNAAKDDWIKQVERLALAWYRGAGVDEFR
jgi:GrpB-like predicted nucleotidyltransferase (UPF0157 family)